VFKPPSPEKKHDLLSTLMAVALQERDRVPILRVGDLLRDKPTTATLLH
jgi:hypothetical protein